MLYLSPKHVPPKYRHAFGNIQNAINNKTPLSETVSGRPWILDNGCFTNAWRVDKWLVGIDALRPYMDSCIGVVVPDSVGDSQKTLEMWDTYRPLVPIGWPVAFVTQDGLQPSMVPWNEIDCLFIGGTDKHKRGVEAGRLIDEAIRRNIWVHVGRVNSLKLINKFWMSDTVDGTHIVKAPDKNYPRVYRWVMNIRQRKRNQLALFPRLTLGYCDPTPKLIEDWYCVCERDGTIDHGIAMHILEELGIDVSHNVLYED